MPSKKDVYFRQDPAVLIISLGWHETKVHFGRELRNHMCHRYRDHEDLVSDLRIVRPNSSLSAYLIAGYAYGPVSPDLVRGAGCSSQGQKCQEEQAEGKSCSSPRGGGDEQRRRGDSVPPAVVVTLVNFSLINLTPGCFMRGGKLLRCDIHPGHW